MCPPDGHALRMTLLDGRAVRVRAVNQSRKSGKSLSYIPRRIGGQRLQHDLCGPGILPRLRADVIAWPIQSVTKLVRVAILRSKDETGDPGATGKFQFSRRDIIRADGQQIRLDS